MGHFGAWAWKWQCGGFLGRWALGCWGGFAGFGRGGMLA